MPAPNQLQGEVNSAVALAKKEGVAAAARKFGVSENAIRYHMTKKRPAKKSKKR